MKHGPLLLIGAVCLCMGTALPYRTECSLLDRVAEAAKPGLATQSAALEILERVAEARMDDARADLEEQVGLKPAQLRGAAFKDQFVRSHALRDIGTLNLPEALAYLQNLKPGDLPPDSTQTVWPEAQIALTEALTNRVPDEPGKIRTLENAIVEGSPATAWAVQQLCDHGSYSSLALIEAYFRRSYSEPRTSELYGSCKARMDVLSRNPNRVVALGSVLNVENGFGNRELIGWTISKLAAMNSQAAYAELERYMNGINALPDGSPSKNRGIQYAQRIRDLLPARPTGGGHH